MPPRARTRQDGRPWLNHQPWAHPGVERVPMQELVSLLDVHVVAPPDLHEPVIAVALEPGRWTPPDLFIRRGLVLFLVEGALMRRHRGSADLAFRGDAVPMADESARWRVLTSEPARVILVGPATASALGLIPGAAHALMTALVQQVERERELRETVGIQRIEDRIVAFFRLLARRAGVLTDHGVRIPLALEQKRIEEILSAGHTQATMAFRSLFAAGVLVHDAAGWLFRARDLSSAPNLSLGMIGAGPNTILPLALALLPL
jgi:hypothetical protein